MIRLIFVILASVQLASCQKQFTREELQGYIDNKENGLLKSTIHSQGEITISYYPRSLMFGQNESHSNECLEYFTVRHSGGRSGALQRVHESVLVIDNDSLLVADVLRLPNVDPMARNLTTILAFQTCLTLVNENPRLVMYDVGDVPMSFEFNIDRIKTVASAAIK